MARESSATLAKTGGRGERSSSGAGEEIEGELVRDDAPVELRPAIAHIRRFPGGLVAQPLALRPGQGDGRLDLHRAPPRECEILHQAARLLGEKQGIERLVVDATPGSKSGVG